MTSHFQDGDRDVSQPLTAAFVRVRLEVWRMVKPNCRIVL